MSLFHLNRKILFFILIITFGNSLNAFAQKLQLVEDQVIKSGASQTELYFPILSGKRIGIVANHTSFIGNTHLVDFLISSGFNVKKIFTPEHGFRGNEDAGASIQSGFDENTGLQVISLYGSKKKPNEADLIDIDVIVFDLQDVGVRFYTYISTLTYMMDACAENGVTLVLLDRPNPNGFYIDGPVLKPALKSFVGLHPVPVVYGLTIGEYGLMVNGENWLDSGLKCKLTVIPLKGYQRNMIAKLPIKPSPNLPNWESVFLYPSLCFFEGTAVSVGRGTDSPFQMYGHPLLVQDGIQFTPKSIKGASSKPKLEGQICNGKMLTAYAHSFEKNANVLNLNWLIEAFQQLSIKTEFFNSYFDKLSGDEKLRKQIEAGMSAEEIRKSWVSELEAYKKIRINYLIYPDFE